MKERTVFAPAKINLSLHVLKRKRDGYHTLESLIAFADIGDTIRIVPSDHFSFKLDGPFAKAFNDQDRRHDKDSGNLVVRAAQNLAAIARKSLDFEITLTKNIPLASGLGGGSADAAAVLHGLADIWGVSRDAQFWPVLLRNLGADVPVCMDCQPALVRGIGEILDPVPALPEIPVVIVNPLKPCPTKAVFLHNKCIQPRESAPVPEHADYRDFILYLKSLRNDLEAAASEIVPEIHNILNALSVQDGCDLARLSGSGASCYGLFATEDQAMDAKKQIHQENPDWWVEAGWLNRIARY